MCCTMIIPGQSTGIAERKRHNAFVPPVDAPTAITLSVVFIMAELSLPLARIASAENFFGIINSFVGHSLRLKVFDRYVALTASHKVIVASSNAVCVLIFGLHITSEAP